MTGRAEELTVIADTLRAGSDYCGVVIAGGAGVGKTRLAAEALRIAQTNGCITHSAVGTSAAQSIPLGAFAQWIDGARGHSLNLVRTVIASLTAGPAGKPVVIAVDDANLLDDLSAFVVHQLVRRRAAQVIIAVRTGKPAADTITALWKDGHLRRIDLQSLSLQECDVLLQKALGGEVVGRTAERMWDLTQGNALFLHELVRQELESGRLSSTAQGWEWAGELTPSPRLIDLVNHYTSAAPDDVLDVLDLVAVAEPIELGYLSALADPAVVEEAERRELIAVSEALPTATVRVAHPLYAEVRRARTGPLCAARLRGRIARVMSRLDLGVGPADRLRLALLWLDSDLPDDPDLFYEGALVAYLRLDLILMQRLSGAAVAAGGGNEVRLLYAQSLHRTGRADEAEVILDGLSAEQSHDFQWVTAVYIRAANLLFTLGRPEDSWQVIDEALATAPPEMRRQLEAFRVSQLTMAARPDEAVAVAESMDIEGLNDLALTVRASGEVAALADLGRFDAATAALEVCNRIVADSPQAAYQTIWNNRTHANILISSGLVRQALSLGEQLVRSLADTPGDPSVIAAATNGAAALAYGDLATAREQLRIAIGDNDSRMDRTGLSYLLWMDYTVALACSGDVEGAMESLEWVAHHYHPSYVLLEPTRLVAAGWVAAARGRTTEAAVSATRAADFAGDHRQFAREVRSLQAAIQFGDNSRVARLVELASFVQGRRVQVVARWAVALAKSDGDELLRVSDDLEDMGDRIAAADAAAHSAITFGRFGRRGSRLTASGRATRIRTECGAITPATQAAATTLPLSSREREVAIMVSQSLANKQIADAMFMSVRTVENHIYRACGKLGVSNRAELATVIRQFITPTT